MFQEKMRRSIGDMKNKYGSFRSAGAFPWGNS